MNTQEKLNLRRFQMDDGLEVADMIGKTLLSINIKDYPIDEMNELAKYYSSDKIVEISNKGHLYVGLINKKIVCCGAAILRGDDNCEYSSFFVDGSFQKQGIGRLLLEQLEKGVYSQRAKKIIINSSITACEFYRRMGYDFYNGNTSLNSDGLYLLVKQHQIQGF